MADLIPIIAITIVIFVLITLVLGKLFRTYRFFSLIPSFIAFCVGVYHMYIVSTMPDDPESLARGIVATILLIGALSGAVTAFIFDRLLPYLAQRNR